MREVCGVLTRAGHQAVTVGGAVRDALLGREPGDWDVASSAKPEEVIALFPRTIPTGLQHGTVTVMAGKGDARQGVEVTTFRGEGAYSDARRPDHVVFGVPLTEDLARRDLVVNAIAYDPEQDELIDPFDGAGDLARKVLRAVGDPIARFTEDGLRVMRALRFAATLEFALDPGTEAAIPAALPSLAKVSRERVHDELEKLLAAPRPSVGLVIAARTGVLAQILPEVAADAALYARVDAADREVRLAALFVGVTPAVTDAALRRLKFSNEDRELAVRLAGVANALAERPGMLQSAVEVRRVLAAVGRATAARAVQLWFARSAESPAAKEYYGLARAAKNALDRGDPIATGELAVGGAELMAELGLAPGKQIGQLLAALLDAVLVDPGANTREALVARARQLVASGSAR